MPGGARCITHDAPGSTSIQPARQYKHRAGGSTIMCCAQAGSAGHHARKRRDNTLRRGAPCQQHARLGVAVQLFNRAVQASCRRQYIRSPAAPSVQAVRGSRRRGGTAASRPSQRWRIEWWWIRRLPRKYRRQAAARGSAARGSAATAVAAAEAAWKWRRRPQRMARCWSGGPGSE